MQYVYSFLNLPLFNALPHRLAQEASVLVGYTKRATLDAKTLQAAVRLLVPGELSKHAVSEGTKVPPPSPLLTSPALLCTLAPNSN